MIVKRMPSSTNKIQALSNTKKEYLSVPMHNLQENNLTTEQKSWNGSFAPPGFQTPGSNKIDKSGFFASFSLVLIKYRKVLLLPPHLYTISMRFLRKYLTYLMIPMYY